jgi:hypothetical protein
MSGGPPSFNGFTKSVPGFGSSSNFSTGGVKSSTTTLDSKVFPSFGGVSKGVPKVNQAMKPPIQHEAPTEGKRWATDFRFPII